VGPTGQFRQMNCHGRGRGRAARLKGLRSGGRLLELTPDVDPSRIDQVLQYALAVTGERLGAIHLMKYVYLADLKYAEEHEGETFTRAPWVFLHFGPWAGEVQDRVAPAAHSIGAARTTFTTAKADGEFVRYRLGNELVAERLRSGLPWEVTSAIRWAAKEHGGNTPSLLRHVYLTEPMLRAAPRDRLAFTGRPKPAPLVATPEEPQPTSVRQRRARSLELEERKAEFQRRLRQQRAEDGKLLPASPAPKYDQVFFQGTEALDRLAGKPIEEMEGEAMLHPGIWKSPSRGDPDA
jgi:hypothetical protein